jgi:hypothetical protein
LPYLEPIISKKILPILIKQLPICTKPVKDQICNLIIQIMKLPNYDIKMEISDFLMKSLVQSKSSIDRQMFLEIAYIAAEEFSQEYFNKHISHLLFLYQKEKKLQVAQTFTKYVHKYKEGSGNH